MVVVCGGVAYRNGKVFWVLLVQERQVISRQRTGYNEDVAEFSQNMNEQCGK